MIEAQLEYCLHSIVEFVMRTHTYMCIPAYTHAHTHAHTHMRIHTHICTYPHAHICIHSCTYIHEQTCAYMDVRTHMSTRTSAYMHTWTHLHTCMRIFTYTYTSTCTYTLVHYQSYCLFPTQLLILVFLIIRLYYDTRILIPNLLHRGNREVDYQTYSTVDAVRSITKPTPPWMP